MSRSATMKTEPPTRSQRPTSRLSRKPGPRGPVGRPPPGAPGAETRELSNEPRGQGHGVDEQAVDQEGRLRQRADDESFDHLGTMSPAAVPPRRVNASTAGVGTTWNQARAGARHGHNGVMAQRAPRTGKRGGQWWRPHRRCLRWAPARPTSACRTSSGRMVSRDDFAEQPALLVMFICNHCPYVKHVAAGARALGRDYQAEGVGSRRHQLPTTWRISRGRPGRHGRGRGAHGLHVPLSLRRDAGGREGVPRRLHAGLLPLRRTSGSSSIAASSTTAGRATTCPSTGATCAPRSTRCWPAGRSPSRRRPSIGCNIKWKPGNEPDYFLSR